MKRTCLTFTTKLSIKQCVGTFRDAVDRRPFRLRIVPVEFYTPDIALSAFDQLEGKRKYDFSVGASIGGNGDSLMSAIGASSVQLHCLEVTGETFVSLDYVSVVALGPSKSLWTHVAGKFREADPGISMEESEERA